MCTALPIRDKISSINIVLFKVDGNKNPRTYKRYLRGGKRTLSFIEFGSFSFRGAKFGRKMYI